MKKAIQKTKEELEYAIVNLELEIKMMLGGRLQLTGDDLNQVNMSITKMQQDLSMVKKKYELLKSY